MFLEVLIRCENVKNLQNHVVGRRFHKRNKTLENIPLCIYNLNFFLQDLDFEPVRMHVNKMDISFANQLFINGEFCNATSGKKSKSINPHDESVICEVEMGSVADVDRAVKAAHKAFHEGEWGKKKETLVLSFSNFHSPPFI